MIRRLRVILPPAWAIMGFVVAYVLMSLPDLFMLWRFGIVVPPVPRSEPREVVLCIGLGLFGAFRALGFHPVFQPSYRGWLETTPWTWRKPLPAGPAHLVWEDALIVLAALAPAWTREGISPWTFATVFLGVYLACQVFAAFATGVWPFGYAILFGLGLVLRLWRWPEAHAITAGVLYLIALTGLRIAMGRFPWSPEWRDQFEQIQVQFQTSGDAAQVDKRLGWPFDRLAPRFPDQMSVRTRDALLLSLLAGWYLHVGGSFFQDDFDRAIFLRLGVAGAIMGGVGIRLMNYLVGYAPPINIWGRIGTFRWIIPGYDKVFVVPIVAAVVGLMIGFELPRSGLPDDVALPIALALTLVTFLTGGPSLKQWRLTGKHRIVPASSAQGKGSIQVG